MTAVEVLDDSASAPDGGVGGNKKLAGRPIEVNIENGFNVVSVGYSVQGITSVT